MTAPVFYVGEMPSSPIVITPTNAPRDLAEYDTITVTGEDLPTGVINVVDNAVQWTPTQPFEVPGLLEARLELTMADESEDWTEPFYLEVHGTPAESFVTTEQAWDISEKAVSKRQLIKAQNYWSMILRMDLGDEELRAELEDYDILTLRRMISWQATQPEPEAAEFDLRNVNSITNGDVGVVYGVSGPFLGWPVHPLAAMEARRLSWRGSRTMHATPFLGDGYRGADEFPQSSSLNARYEFLWPVVGGGW